MSNKHIVFLRADDLGNARSLCIWLYSFPSSLNTSALLYTHFPSISPSVSCLAPLLSPLSLLSYPCLSFPSLPGLSPTTPQVSSLSFPASPITWLSFLFSPVLHPSCFSPPPPPFSLPLHNHNHLLILSPPGSDLDFSKVFSEGDKFCLL